VALRFDGLKPQALIADFSAAQEFCNLCLTSSSDVDRNRATLHVTEYFAK